MSEILFIRHAETDMAGTFCGHSDPELNGCGRLQVTELIDKLKTEEIGVVYTSDLRRAHDTGRAIAEALGIDCRVRSALREINFGQWEGLTWKEIERRDEAYSRRWVAEYPLLPAPNGESFTDFERRVLDEMKFLLLEAELEDRGIAIVTHAGVLRSMLCALQGCLEEEAWEQTRSYCAVIRHSSTVAQSTRLAGVRP
jgi:alpha-ribazole phosphatase